LSPEIKQIIAAGKSSESSRRLHAPRSGEMSGSELVSEYRPLQSVAQVIELQPLALAPLSAARFLSISKCFLSRLIAGGKIVARKDGTRGLEGAEEFRQAMEFFCESAAAIEAAIHSTHI
jgi:hypothetical protein